jgi:hypothetical protein
MSSNSVFVIAVCLFLAGCGGRATTGSSSGGAAGTGGSGGAIYDAVAGGASGGGGCGPGLKACGGDCVATDDPAHGCGAASCAACDVPNATATCQNDGCALQSCNPGFEDCDGDPANGCEIDVDSDPDNCGGCGNACAAPGQPGTCVYCQQGQCQSSACPPYYGDCNCDPSDACEVDLKTDSSNCGFCGHVCASGQSCVNGLCS